MVTPSDNTTAQEQQQQKPPPPLPGYYSYGYASNYYPQGGQGPPPRHQHQVHLPSSQHRQQQQQHQHHYQPLQSDMITNLAGMNTHPLDHLELHHHQQQQQQQQPQGSNWQQTQTQLSPPPPPPPVFDNSHPPQPQPSQFPTAVYNSNIGTTNYEFLHQQQGNNIASAAAVAAVNIGDTPTLQQPWHNNNNTDGPNCFLPTAAYSPMMSIAQIKGERRGSWGGVGGNIDSSSSSSMLQRDGRSHSEPVMNNYSSSMPSNMMMYNPNQPNHHHHLPPNNNMMTGMVSSSVAGSAAGPLMASLNHPFSSMASSAMRTTPSNHQNQHPSLANNGMMPQSSSSSSMQCSSADHNSLPPPLHSTGNGLANTSLQPAFNNNISNTTKNTPLLANTSSTGGVMQPPPPPSSQSAGTVSAASALQPSSSSSSSSSSNNNYKRVVTDEPIATTSSKSLPNSTVCTPRGVQPPPPPKTVSSITSSQPTVAATKGEVQATVDTTSHDYLRSLLRSKKSTTSMRPNAAANTLSSSSKKAKPLPSKPKKATSSIAAISIPSTFSPSHSYRAMAAYSLLRTLSKELRLSPFTFQAFTNSLMLPVPCKLLGEIHVRVLRVLFAAGAEEASLVASSGDGKNLMAGYFYGKFGDGDGVDLIKRRKRTVVTKNAGGAGGRHCDTDDEKKQTINDSIVSNNDSDSGGIAGGPSAEKVLKYEDDVEFVPKKGGNNLTFLDQSTWPLFFQDYALITEGKLLDTFSDYDDIITASVNENDTNGGIATGCGGRVLDDDNDEFIDMRSVAMLPSEDINLHPKTLPDFANDNFYNEKEEEDSSQPGSANYTNWTESASRCPAGPFGKRNHLGRFVCCPFHILAAVQMYRNLLTPACISVALSSGSTNSTMPTTKTSTANSVLRNRSKPRRSVKKARKARRRSSLTVNKGGDDDTENDADDSGADSDDDDYKPPAKYNNPASRATRSIDMTKLPTIHTPMFPSSSPRDCDQSASWKSLHGGVDGRVPHSQVIMTPGQAPTTKAIAVSRSPLSIIHQPLGPPASRQIDTSTKSFRHIVVPEVQLPPPAECTLAVSRKIEKDLECFFSNGPNVGEHVVSDMDPTEDNVSKPLHQRPGELYSEYLLAHMIPVQHLERGIPYHHLCLNDKLTILEFLLDELLQVTEISSEMTRRHGHTLQYSYLYGAIPSPRDYEQMENADECRICGIEGQLLCCDGCPGSFHRTCIGMSAYARLPEGKWLCPECKIVDSSKMAPLESEMRPIIKWFTMGELGLPDHAMSQSHPIQHSQLPSGAVQDVSHPSAMSNKISAKEHFIVLHHVEFLVTSGVVFARYRESFEPFDPLHIMTTSPRKPVFNSSLQVHKALSPPLPLNSCQLAELLKLFGPKLCSYMPWLRIPFTPQKVFSGYLALRNGEITTNDGSALQTPNPIFEDDNYLRFLIYYQDTTKEFLATHPELNNPMEYLNGYRKAPTIPLLFNSQGQHSITSEPQNYSIRAKSLAVAILDMTVHRDQNVCIPYLDPLNSIRNAMIQLEKTLGEASLLDVNWGTNDNAAQWRKMVENTNSIMKLGSLLVNLIDVCSTIAFVPDWYNPKGCSSPERVDSTERVSISSEDWSAKRESIRRKWERSQGNDILRLHKGILGCKGSTLTKRGKVRKSSDVSIEAVHVESVSIESRGNPDQNSLAQSTSRRRSDRHSTIRQQIEMLLGVGSIEMSDGARAILDLQIDRLERTLAEEDTFSIHWPIAGQSLFEPDGSLPRHIVRRLARNAGSARAPSIAYDTAWDVGETTVCHRWRKITNRCNSYEGLLHSLTFLNAHLNTSTIMTATTIANRKASNTTSIIRCVHSDPCTGFIEYFVVPMDKKAGRWYSEQSVDLTALIHYRCERRKHFEQLVRTKEAPHTALQSGKKREASTCSVDATAPTKKTRVERGTKKVDSRLQLVLDKHRDDVVRLLNESASGEKSLSTELLEELRSKNLIEMRRENLLVYQEGGDLLEEFELRNRLTESEKESKKKVLADRRRGLSEKKRAFQAVFNQHRDDIRNLVKDSYARGEASVDINLIEIARAKNLVDLRSANILVEQFGGKLLSEDELKSQMTSAETQALRLIELDKKSAEKKVRAAARQKEANLKDRERELRRAIDMHRDVTVCLMKTCAARGEAVVSTMLIEKARSQNLVGIRAANLFVHKAGGKLLGEIELKIELAKAEQAASKLYQRDVKGQDRQSQSSTKRAAPTNSALVQPPVKKMKDEGLQDKEREFQAALNRHRDDTIRLMKECASRGESGVSIEDMTATRSKNILALENANRSIHQAGGAKLVDMELKVRMSRAEKEAVDMYVQEVRSRLSS